MNPLSLIIGVPLGFWLSDKLHHDVPGIIARAKVSHAAAMENRFGADMRQCDERKAYEAQREENGRRQRAEFRKRNGENDN